MSVWKLIAITGGGAALVVIATLLWFTAGPGGQTPAGLQIRKAFEQVTATVTPTPTATPTPTPTVTAVPSTTISFVVPTGQSHTVNFDLAAGARLEYRFRVTQGRDLDVDFAARDPNGNVLTEQDRASTSQGVVTAERLGRYSLVFGNEFSVLASKTVELTHRVVAPGGR